MMHHQIMHELAKPLCILNYTSRLFEMQKLTHQLLELPSTKLLTD